ncbi:MAG: universal stress protein [Myxococcota bacterium]
MTRERAPVWIVCHDFSPCAEGAVLQAARDAGCRGARIVLVHALSPQLLASELDWEREQTTRVPWTLHLSEARERTRARLETCRERLRTAFPDVPVGVEVVVGSPPDALVEAAEDLGAERIVVGSHGRRGLGRLVLGSVAEELVRMSSVPVLVTKRRVEGEGGAP